MSKLKPHLLNLTLWATVTVTLTATSIAQAKTTRANHGKPHKTSIQTLQKTIAAEKAKHDRMKSDFQHTDEKVNQLQHSLKKTSRELNQQKASLRILKKEKSALTKQLAQQKKDLALTLSSAYKMSDKSLIKLILKQQNPETISRLVKYHSYVSRSHFESIHALQQTLIHLQSTEKQMQTYQSALQHTIITQNQQKSSLQKTRSQRNRMLKSLEKSIESKQHVLKKLKHDKHALDKVVSDVKTPRTKPTVRFAKHSLPWPIHGPITQHFNEPIHHSEFKTHGIVITGKEGTPIRAIADGTVVFAKWMSGFGLLIILEHNNGFMSLYGRNDSLEREVGDVVKAGDPVATLGHSGAFTKTGLYFEIRQGDRPVNPEDFLDRSH